MKAKIFNVVVYSMLGWSILSAVYLALPVEYQEMLPQMNWLTAVISGGSTALLGSGGLAVQSFMTKAKVTADTKYVDIVSKFLKLVDEYKALEAKYEDIVISIERNNILLATDLKTKLSNPLIDETSKELIEGVLYGDKQEQVNL